MIETNTNKTNNKTIDYPFLPKNILDNTDIQ